VRKSIIAHLIAFTLLVVFTFGTLSTHTIGSNQSPIKVAGNDLTTQIEAQLDVNDLETQVEIQLDVVE